uniref:ribosomal protein L19 n=1 Tax=Haramonas pauciplastida TaxID=478668 RepID=UPI0021145510|nr:ribosomal protein L19 [Haramonas pauciplastida]UTE94991.1 ribosomal protein L19 [Haramonas pauciplastida]
MSDLIIKTIERPYLKSGLPNIKVGDLVKLGLLIVEGNKERIQYYQGVVLVTKGPGLRKTLTVRKIIQGIGVEKTFLIHSPKITSINILRSSKIRRAKLYYLRNLSGKATRLKQRR